MRGPKGPLASTTSGPLALFTSPSGAGRVRSVLTGWFRVSYEVNGLLASDRVRGDDPGSAAGSSRHLPGGLRVGYVREPASDRAEDAEARFQRGVYERAEEAPRVLRHLFTVVTRTAIGNPSSATTRPIVIIRFMA